jgi:hypothetical protein
MSLNKKRFFCFARKTGGAKFANTLAKILNIPGPSASTFEILPGV